MSLVRVPCIEIKPDPQSSGCQPDEVEVLAESIRKDGLLRPIVVRQAADGYVIVHGERRWRAACSLGHATILAWLVLDYLHTSAGML
jgi:ParB family chromosome partitioning protein